MNTVNQSKEMENFQHNLDNLVKYAPVRKPVGLEEPLPAAEWSPLVDISEDDHEYLIKAELPEVLRADVRVTAEAGALTIMGERKFEKEEKGKRYHRVERAYGSFGRTFQLPSDVNPNNVSAEFKDGVLSVHLIKNEKTGSQQIEIAIS